MSAEAHLVSGTRTLAKGNTTSETTMRRDVHGRVMTESKPPRDAFDELERGKRVRLVLGEVTDEERRPADPFETEVEWVHSRRDEADMTITYRAEFAPPEGDDGADLYYLEMDVPEEGEPDVSALMAESNDDGERTTRRVAAVERLEVLD